MLYSQAKQLADELVEVMKPYCLKIEIAGSVRRKKKQVHDIEICLVPENANKLFNVLGKYLLSKNKNFKYTKNGNRYKQFIYKESQVDLFIAKPDNWGIIFLVRSGSAAFSTKMLAAWKKVSEGGYSKDGYLYDKDDKIVYTYEENDVFRLCRMDFVEPEERSVDFP